ncbi:MAG: plastocyanin/azurin family copper-binding protein [Acidobacteriota bacterium]
MKTTVTAIVIGLGLAAIGATTSTNNAPGTVSGVVHLRSVARLPTLVYIEEISGRTFHPPTTPVVMDQEQKLFSPHVLPILTGTTVDFVNSDSFEHNVFSPDGEKFDLGKWGQGGKRAYTFKTPGIYTQLCRIHPEMVGYVIVLQNPCFAMADKQGAFHITHVPPGNWRLKVWNERLRPKKLRKSFEITVSPGQEARTDISF